MDELGQQENYEYQHSRHGPERVYDDCSSPARIPRFPESHQCRTIPACESVNDRNTPTA